MGTGAAGLGGGMGAEATGVVVVEVVVEAIGAVVVVVVAAALDATGCIQDGRIPSIVRTPSSGQMQGDVGSVRGSYRRHVGDIGGAGADDRGSVDATPVEERAEALQVGLHERAGEVLA